MFDFNRGDINAMAGSDQGNQDKPFKVTLTNS